MKIAAEGHLTTEALMWNQNNQHTISGMVCFMGSIISVAYGMISY